MLYDGATYHMWYTRKYAANSSKECIGYATSANGLNWTLIDTAVIVSSTISTRFDSKKVGQLTVIKDGNTFKMWYWGDGQNTGCIGYATSPDGRIWTKVNGAALHQSVFDKNLDGSNPFGLVTPYVLKDGSTYRMWYTRVAVVGGVIQFTIACATSTDGLPWTKVNGTAGPGGRF